jgi:hypothetical protein
MQVKRKVSIILCVIIAIMAVLIPTTALMSASQNVNSFGTVTAINVGVYVDAQCTQNATSVSWGTIAPGSNASRQLYVKNLGTASETLSLASGAYVPSAFSAYALVTWNATSYVLPRGQSVCVTITLAISPSVSGVADFSFTLTITGTE